MDGGEGLYRVWKKQRIGNKETEKDVYGCMQSWESGRGAVNG